MIVQPYFSLYLPLFFIFSSYRFCPRLRGLWVAQARLAVYHGANILFLSLSFFCSACMFIKGIRIHILTMGGNKHISLAGSI